MAIGSAISYPGGPQMWGILLKHLQSKCTQDGSADAKPGGWKNPRICVKVSNTAPTDDTEADIPAALGDICLHYNAAGVLQDAYFASSGNLESGGSGTCNWIQIGE